MGKIPKYFCISIAFQMPVICAHKLFRRSKDSSCLEESF